MFRIFCGFSLYYILIQWFCVTFVSIVFYIAEHVDNAVSLNMNSILRRNLRLNCLECSRQTFIGREMKQKQLHCLNKLIDLRHGVGGGKFHYYPLLNSIKVWAVAASVSFSSLCLSCSSFYSERLVLAAWGHELISLYSGHYRFFFKIYCGILHSYFLIKFPELVSWQ